MVPCSCVLQFSTEDIGTPFATGKVVVVRSDTLSLYVGSFSWTLVANAGVGGCGMQNRQILEDRQHRHLLFDYRLLGSSDKLGRYCCLIVYFQRDSDLGRLCRGSLLVLRL